MPLSKRKSGITERKDHVCSDYYEDAFGVWCGDENCRRLIQAKVKGKRVRSDQITEE